MAPVNGTMNPAPAESLTSLTVTVNPRGAPKTLASSVNDCGVLAIQIGVLSKPNLVKSSICIAKTPQSLTDDAKVLGAPRGFTVTVKEVRLSAGAGFIVPLTGAIMTMPGLPKVPAAVKMEDVPYDQKLDH